MMEIKQNDNDEMLILHHKYINKTTKIITNLCFFLYIHLIGYLF